MPPKPLPRPLPRREGRLGVRAWPAARMLSRVYMSAGRFFDFAVHPLFTSPLSGENNAPNDRPVCLTPLPMGEGLGERLPCAALPV